MSDFQYTYAERDIMVDHWRRGRLSDTEITAYHARWWGRAWPEVAIRTARRNEEIAEMRREHETTARQLGWI